MKLFSVFLSFFFVVNFSFSQCIEIERILVDACSNSSPSKEGENEMVLFKVGSQALNTADMDVSWATTNLSFPGLIQNAQTAQIVADINATIVSCGSLSEPVGGILPSGSLVLLVTSHQFEVGAHSFAGLSDDLIILFQNATRGNNGHFGNHGATAIRNFSISFSSPSSCSDMVSYDRSLLVKLDGTPGAEDGGFVSYTPNGTATYGNLGCQVPADILSIAISSDINSVCGGETISLTANIEGAFQSVIWQSSQGAFSSQGGINTSMNVNSNVTNSFYIYGGVESNCNDTIYDSLLISINGVPNVSIVATDDTLCTGQNVTLTASGADAYVWNNGASSANPLTVASGGIYTVVGTSNCGVDSATINIDEITAPLPIIVPSPMFSCDSNELHEVDLSTNVCESCIYTWSDGTIGEIYSGIEPNFSVSIQNYCGTQMVSYNYDVITVSANIIVQDSIGDSPFLVPFNSNSQGTSYSWNFDNGNTSSLQNPTEVFSLPGEYQVVLTVSEQGCIATDNQMIIVNGDLLTEVIIPNVFTPNNDNQNDVFSIQIINGKTLAGSIFNRWGTKIKELDGLSATWDGGNNSAGTYYYILEVEFLDNSKEEYTGVIQLMK